MPAKTLVVPPPHLRNWKRASSGISVDAGPVRIRMEAEGTRDQRIDIARLIAAAPELLEALKQAVAELGQMESANEPGGACDKATKNAIKLGHAAIAKAVDG